MQEKASRWLLSFGDRQKYSKPANNILGNVSMLLSAKYFPMHLRKVIISSFELFLIIRSQLCSSFQFGQEPPLVLLDCSKLQLGRGRLDDSVSAFRKRLELFREVSLPMLKTLDNEERLTIVSFFNILRNSNKFICLIKDLFTSINLNIN